MRIKEFVLHRYGPLTETGVVRLNNFDLFWGENEEGKTLIIEALIKLLLGKTRKLKADIDRVSEQPDGFIIIQHGEGEEAKIPEQGRISDLVNLSAEECANLFIIRNSDLTIERESEFYGSVTERLTGLRSSQIEKVKKSLLRLGYLTDTYRTVDDSNSQHLATRLARAAELIQKCEKLSREAREKAFDHLEEKLVGQQRELERLIHEIQLQEKARLREKFEKGREYLGKLIEVQSQIDQLKNYTEDTVTTWYQAQKQIRDEEEQLARFKKRIQTYQQELEFKEKRHRESENELDILKKKQTRLEETLKPAFRKHREMSEQFAVNNTAKKFLTYGLLFISLAALVSLAGVIWKPGFATYLAGGITGMIWVVLSVWYSLKLILPQRRIEKCKQDVFSQAGEFGFIGGGIPELQSQLHGFEESVQRQEQKVTALATELHILRNRITELQQERIAHSEQRLRTAQQTVQEIRLQFGVENLEEYQQKLRQRKQLEQAQTEARSVLKNLFGEAGNTAAQRIKYWEDQIEGLKPVENEAVGIRFDERELERKKAAKDKLQEEVLAIQKQLENFQDELSQIERETRDALLLEKDHYPCQNLSDLETVIARLKDFIHKIESKQNLVKKALSIFSEIEKEESQKVGTLFGEDKPVSQFFQQITGSTYQIVHYEPAESLIQVRHRDGRVLSARWLSGGAYDQLYFAIRLALGQELLQGQTGFFILDDPFIKSDRGRLERMMEILVEISRQGWQVIYFSAKDEILDVLKTHVESKEVILHQVPKSKLLFAGEK